MEKQMKSFRSILQFFIWSTVLGEVFSIPSFVDRQPNQELSVLKRQLPKKTLQSYNKWNTQSVVLTIQRGGGNNSGSRDGRYSPERIHRSAHLSSEALPPQHERQQQLQQQQLPIRNLPCNHQNLHHDHQQIGTTLNYQHHHHQQQQRPQSKVKPPCPPSPPNVLPLRFLRAGKNDPKIGLQRYETTLLWRKQNHIDTIIHESFPLFHIIKQHYPHYFHYTGYNNEPCFYEQPAKTNFKALKNYNITKATLLRHYSMITEFQWQFLQRNDTTRSIYVIDLDGITMGSFFTETIDFVKQAASISSQHYPERAGYVYIINVPSWFKLIWQVIRPIIDESTLQKIHILRGTDEIRQQLMKHIPIEHIPPNYGGTSVPLGYSPQERILAQFMEHNNILAKNQCTVCPNCHSDVPTKLWPCRFCRWIPARSY